MKIRKLLPLLVCLVLIGVCWMLGIGCGDVTFSNLDQEGLSFRRSGNKSFYLGAGDEHGVLSGGPGFTLPAGQYALRVTVDSDGDNLLRIQTSNGAKAEPNELVLPAQSWENYLTFELKEDARDLEFQIDFQQGEYFRLHGFDLIMKDVRDGTWMLTFALVLIAVLYVLNIKGVLTREGRVRLLIVSMAVLCASVPALRENLYGGHDTLFHQMRLHNVVDALRSGQFPVRMGGYGYNGYGSAVSIFYPDVFLYFPALMMVTGATVQCAMRTYIIAMNAISAATMYICGKRIFESRAAGTCASILYTLASYRLLDIYLRDALGEYTAMAMLPLFVLGLWEVIFGDAKRWRTLALGAAAIFMSHMLSTVLCAGLALIFVLLGFGKIIREKRLAVIVKAALGALALCLFVLVPLLDYAMQGIGDSGTFATSVGANALQPMELFVTKNGEAKGLGWALLLGISVLGYAALNGQGEKKQMQAALLLAGLGAAFALAATNLMPWAQLEKFTRGLINYLQFPYRLMAFADVLIALGAGYGITCLLQEKGQKELASIAVLVVCVMCAYPQIEGYAIQSEEPPEFGLRYADPYFRWKSYSDVITGSYLEYTLPGSDLGATVDQNVLVNGDVQMDGYIKSGTQIKAVLAVQEESRLTFPLFAFDGYRVQINGNNLPVSAGENQRLTVTLPAGTEGELRVWFAGKTIWRIADGVSLFAMLGLAARLIKRKKGAVSEGKSMQM